MSWFWGTATNPQYEELVEKACSPLNLPYPQSEDMANNLEITDMIRSKAVQPKPAMQSLKRRVASKNGRVQMYAFALIDTCIKNGGDHFLAEIASKEFVDEVSSVIKNPTTPADVRQMFLRLFQSWAIAFKPKQELAYLVEVYNELKAGGQQFPPEPTQTSSHLLTTTTAPAWVDSDVCMRCRTAFTFTNRKHHCRNCGLVFDQACSSKMMPLPKYGITEEVRVCEGCWVKSGKGKSQVPAGPAPAVPGRTPRTRQDLDADLQRAIELSLQDVQPGRSYVGSEPPLRASNPEDDDEQLRLAIEASLKEMEMRPSAPIGADEPEYKPLPTFDLSARETETILTFSNTMDQMAAYGERDLRRFPHAHVLANQAYALGGKLQRNAEEKTTKQQMLAEMQSKLSQAVAMYGQILDGQQAYSARKLQESQQRQYTQHQQYAPPQQYGYAGYTPYGQTNGYVSAYPSYAPQPAPAQSPPPITSGPSMYPSMPTFAPVLAQDPYTSYHQQYSAQPVSQHAPPVQPQWTPQQTYEPASQAPPDPARQPSVYAPTPTPEAQASAPPPVDLASHPSTSPRAITTGLPSAPQRTASYASSTSPVAPAPIGSPTRTMSESWSAQGPPQSAHHQQGVPQHAPQQPYAPQQQHYAPQQTQLAAPPQNVYSVASFPSAPAAVFPDAPSAEPQGLEKKEKEEALLIEL